MKIQSGNTRPRAQQDSLHPFSEAGWLASVRQLHQALNNGGYRSIQRIPTAFNPFALPLEPWNFWGFLRGHRRLMESSAVPGVYRLVTRIADRRLERQFAFFLLGETISGAELEILLQSLPSAPNLRTLSESGVVATDSAGGFRACIRFVPANRLLLVTDPYDRSIPDFAYMGRDSLFLADRVRERVRGRRFGRALDLCCGTGVQGLNVAEFSARVEGADLNPRAVAYANLNAELNNLSSIARFRVGDLAAGFDGPYDLVISNPPFVLMTPEEARSNLDGHGGGELGLELPLRIAGELNRLLGPEGEAYMLCNCPVVDGEPMLPGLLEKSIGNGDLGATVVFQRYMVDGLRFRFYESRGVGYVISCIVHFSRRLRQEVRVERLPLPARAANSAYVALARSLFTRRNR